jgi:hypothetical protein
MIRIAPQCANKNFLDLLPPNLVLNQKNIRDWYISCHHFDRQVFDASSAMMPFAYIKDRTIAESIYGKEAASKYKVVDEKKPLWYVVPTRFGNSLKDLKNLSMNFNASSHTRAIINDGDPRDETIRGLRDVNSNSKDLIELQREQIAILKQQLLQARQAPQQQVGVQNMLVASPPGGGESAHIFQTATSPSNLPVDQNDHSGQNENRIYLREGNRRKPVVQTLGTYCTIKRLVEAWNVHNHDLVDNAKQADLEGCGCKNAKRMFTKKSKESIEESMIECSKLRRQ